MFDFLNGGPTIADLSKITPKNFDKKVKKSIEDAKNGKVVSSKHYTGMMALHPEVHKAMKESS